MKSYLFASLFTILLLQSSLAFSADKPLQVQAKIDSLLAELPNAKGDTNEVRLLYNLSTSYYQINSDESITYGKRGLKLAKRFNHKKMVIDLYNSIGRSYVWKSDYDNAMILYNNALLIDEIDSIDISMANTLRNIAGVYLEKSNYPKSLEYYQKALSIYQRIEDKYGIAYCYGNMGILYKFQSKIKEALNYNKKALKLNRELKDKHGIIKNLRSIGGLYLRSKNFDLALEYFNKSLKQCKKIGDKNGTAMSLGSIGYTYIEQSKYKLALDYYQRALKINKEINKRRGIAYNYLSLGILYYNIADRKNEIEQLDFAINYLLKSETLYKSMNNLNELSLTYDYLHKSYYKKGLFKKSIDSHREYKLLQDSIFSNENANKIAALEKAREDDVNRIKIEKQEVKLAAQESEKMFIIFSGIGIIIFVSFILVMIAYQRKKSDQLLYNVLPISIAKRLKKKEHPISDHFVQASIIFIDIVGFTAMSKESDPTDIVQALNKVFTHYDSIARKHGLEKIKTIGDCYMAAAGIPVVQKDNTLRAARMAIEVRDYMVDYYTDHGFKLDVRIGLDCGPVVAGVIGENKFIYDMWSDAVNTASRMESTGSAGRIQISERFKEAVSEYKEFDYVERGEIEIKGKGMMKTYYIENREVESV